VGQMAAPGFDSESNLHRAGSDWLIRMRMEAWVEAESSLQEKLLLTGRGRLMEGHRCVACLGTYAGLTARAGQPEPTAFLNESV
jgi:hypothetical protein